MSIDGDKAITYVYHSAIIKPRYTLGCLVFLNLSNGSLLKREKKEKVLSWIIDKDQPSRIS